MVLSAVRIPETGAPVLQNWQKLPQRSRRSMITMLNRIVRKLRDLRENLRIKLLSQFLRVQIKQSSQLLKAQ